MKKILSPPAAFRGFSFLIPPGSRGLGDKAERWSNGRSGMAASHTEQQCFALTIKSQEYYD